MGNRGRGVGAGLTKNHVKLLRKRNRQVRCNKELRDSKVLSCDLEDASLSKSVRILLDDPKEFELKRLVSGVMAKITEEEEEQPDSGNCE